LPKRQSVIVIGLLILVSLVVVVASPPVAFACRSLNLEASLAYADIAFVGTLTAASEPPERPDSGPYYAVFEVTQVLKGDIPRTVTIIDRITCRGLPLFIMDGYGAQPRSTSREYLVFAKKKDGSYSAYGYGYTWMTDEPAFAKGKEEAIIFIRRQMKRLSDSDKR
jgi:hypothetical protein